jgi:GPH family glycoside/pentoside/hexuronide:cation symporter
LNVNSGKLRLSTKIAYGFGQLGEMLFLGLTLAFIPIFYNQAVGLSAELVGTALFVGIFADAISDPLIGSISDRWRSKRFGRRHPFLFVSAPPLALCLYMLFQPPAALIAIPIGETLPDQWPLFAWMTTWLLLGRFFMTLYIIPHLALGAELSTDYDERASVFSYNAMFGFFFGPMIAFVAWTFFFAGEGIRVSDGALVAGQLNPANYQGIAILAAIGIVVGVWICAGFTLSQVKRLPQPPADLPPFRFSTVFVEVYEAFRNKSYLMLMLGYFCLSLTLGHAESTNTIIFTFFWELEPSQIRWFSFFATVGFVAGAFMAPFLIKLIQKRPLVIIGVVGYGLIHPSPYILRMAGLWPENGAEALLPMLLVWTVLATWCLAALNVCVMSMLADLVDEHQLKSGRRQEGIFFSARIFFAKASNSVASLLAGITLAYYAQLPPNSIPGSLDDDILSRMGLLVVLFSIGALVAGWFYSRYTLDKDRVMEIQQELADRARANSV